VLDYERTKAELAVEEQIVSKTEQEPWVLEESAFNIPFPDLHSVHFVSADSKVENPWLEV